MVNIPVGVLALFMLFLFLFAGMAYEAYIRPKLLILSKRLHKRTHKRTHTY